jgi:DNA invertase Pin-like site-specific DNA recombinase
MKRAIGYVRVSTKDGRQDSSIEWQKYLIKDFCRENGYHLDEVFVECKSAYKGQPREILNAALEYREQHDCFLIATAVDRLTRTTKDIALFNNHIEKILVIGQGSDPLNASVFAVFVAAAQRESEMISKRLKWALKAKKEREPEYIHGNPDIRTTAVPASLKVRTANAKGFNIETAALIKECRGTGCKTLQEIADRLNLFGHKTRRKSKWTPSSVHRVENWGAQNCD